MIRSLVKPFLVVALLSAVCAAAYAQPSTSPSPGAARMFDGEKLVYDGKINKILRGISIAELTFIASVPAGSDDKLVIKSEAVSKGTLLKIFRYSFLQQYESTVDLSTFKILRTAKHDVQKERVRDSEAVFDYEGKRVTYVETDPKDKMRPPRRIASEIGDHLNDMISAIYAVRLMPLKVGTKMELAVSDSGLVYKVPFTVTGKETISTLWGKMSCLKIEPEIFGHDRLIEREGKLIIWMTDDVRHVPVRAHIHSEYGKIDVKLKSAAKLPG